MKVPAEKSAMIEKLRQDILELQGFRQPLEGGQLDFGLGPVDEAFPNHTFPVGAMHEFISTTHPDSASTIGFMSVLLARLMQHGGMCLWISMNRKVFPPGLKYFGVEPDQIIFIDLKKEKDLLWCIEEGLKCRALAAVVGELTNISFAESRRLQLTVEESRVTGFLHRERLKSVNTLACVSRWQVTSIPSQLEPGMPGVGHPRWRIELQKIRNGEPGAWDMEWSAGRLRHVPSRPATKTGTDWLGMA